MTFKDATKPTVFKLFLVCLMLAGLVAYIYYNSVLALGSCMSEQAGAATTNGPTSITALFQPPSLFSISTLFNIGYLALIILIFYVIAFIIEQAYLKIFKKS